MLKFARGQSPRIYTLEEHYRINPERFPSEGLILHLNAATLPEGPVTEWLDPARGLVAEPTGSASASALGVTMNAPLRIAGGIPALTGSDAVTVAVRSSLGSGSLQILWEMSPDYNGVPGTNILFYAPQENNVESSLQVGTGSPPVNAYRSSTSPHTDGSMNRLITTVSFTSAQPSATLMINGQSGQYPWQNYTTQNPAQRFIAADVFLGGRGQTGGYVLGGRLSEVIAWNRVLTPSELASVDAYLNR